MTLKNHFLFVCITLVINVLSAQNKILFDATKAETASNADWIIDADVNNLSWSPTAVLAGTESNAQRIPTPLQATITASTVETYWKGALSSWGIDCVKKGFTVESLPYNGHITFNDATNTQDLSNYKVFIVCEPNILFTASEKTAIIAFVKSGGGLFMISDHQTSDRNNDNKDSPVIWNDLMANNGGVINPFGITFENNNIGNINSNNLAVLPANDSLLHGAMGNVTQLAFHAGTSIAIDKTANTSAHGIVYTTGVSNTGATGMMCAAAMYGKGKVVALGDSSIPDDGTGDANDNLFDGYANDVYATDNGRKLLVNATLWLAAYNLKLASNEIDAPKLSISIAPNPIASDLLTFKVSETDNRNVNISIYNAIGTCILSKNDNILRGSTEQLNVADLPIGLYFLSIQNGEKRVTERFIKN